MMEMDPVVTNAVAQEIDGQSMQIEPKQSPVKDSL